MVKSKGESGLMQEGLSHVAVSFFMPIAWAIILYPICRRYHLTWVKTIFFVLMGSFVAMVIKEFFDKKISVNDIAADVAGLFFGVAFLSAVFTWGGKQISKLAVGVFQVKEEVSLWDFLTVIFRMEQRAAAFFEEASKRLSHQRSRELCSELADEERKQADLINAKLSEWTHKAFDESILDTLEEMIVSQGIYTKPILSGASEKDILEYAIEMKSLIQDLYSSFIRSFPFVHVKEQLRKLLEYQRDQKEQLKGMLSTLL